MPTPEQKDARQLHRELQTAKRDRTRVTNRIKGLLANQGLVMDLKGDWLMRLDTRRLWDGSPIAPALRARLAREWRKVELYTAQIAELETLRKERVKAAADESARMTKQLFELKGQPRSALARWYQRRFGGGGSRLRRIGIVALARRLLIDLWRYLETGALPQGAELKPVLKY